MIFGRRRFGDVIDRQLALFRDAEGDLLEELRDALAAYDAADRDDAEELYGDYLLVVDACAERLAEMRDRFARTLAEGDDDRYEDEFNRAVAKAWPHVGTVIDTT